jgi:hypothetical protein
MDGLPRHEVAAAGNAGRGGAGQVQNAVTACDWPQVRRHRECHSPRHTQRARKAPYLLAKPYTPIPNRIHSWGRGNVGSDHGKSGDLRPRPVFLRHTCRVGSLPRKRPCGKASRRRVPAAVGPSVVPVRVAQRG